MSIATSIGGAASLGGGGGAEVEDEVKGGDDEDDPWGTAAATEAFDVAEKCARLDQLAAKSTDCVCIALLIMLIVLMF